LLSDPVTAPLVDNNTPDSDVRGTVKERYFFRQSAGPGWVLVGDAGDHKEFVIGDGITEALIQVRSIWFGTRTRGKKQYKWRRTAAKRAGTSSPTRGDRRGHPMRM